MGLDARGLRHSGSDDVGRPVTNRGDRNRRGVYILISRNSPFSMFEAFDNPDSAVSCPERDVTTVVPQVLWLLNDAIAFRQALEFAGRLVKDAGDEPLACVQQAWRLAFGREPLAEEQRDALALVDSLSKRKLPEQGLGELPASLAKILRSVQQGSQDSAYRYLI